MVGYRVLDRAHDRLVNQLSGWDDRMVPEQWQPHPTVFERAVEGASPYRFRLKNSGRQIPITSPLSQGSISQIHLSTQGGTIYFRCH